MSSYRRFRPLAGLVLLALLVAACSGPSAAATTAPTAAPQNTAAPSNEPVTITWWHITTADNQKAVWQKLADEFTAANPHVTIEITVLENEAFKTKLTTVLQSDDMPDIFQSWGGGGMNEYAEAGLLKDITADLDADGGAWRNTFSPGALGVYAYQGTNYGVPWDMGMVGFWYNKDLFAQAGIEAPPATWGELLTAVEKLKAAGITPIALGAGDKWPAAFWWEYLATRIGGQAAFDAAASRAGGFADPAFVQAGEKILELAALDPFQAGVLGATWGDEATLMGNGEAAMDLMGQWAPGAFNDNSVDKLGIGDALGWFPFPAVEGGAGAATDALGGGNGFAIGRDAPQAAVDFVKYLTRAESQVQCAEEGFCVPVVKGGEAGLSDPLLLAVQQGAAAADYFQLYYDQYLPPAMGSIVNDNVQAIFAETLTPQEAAQAIEDAAAQEMQ